MIDDIVKRIGLMAEYANKFVYKYGVEQLKFRDVLFTRNLIIYNNSSYEWGFYHRIDKEISGDIHYITNAEHSGIERSPEFDWYEVKSDIDTCESASNLKRTVRDMIKNPQNYIRIN
ncbi:MAG: hypothetical protein GY941_17840 [Planctomycetes bacterium]|nr:hypothetical protein [Planctomycetota bacterium]